MELIIAVVLGLTGFALTIYFGRRSNKYRDFLESYHQLDLEKRQLLKELERLKSTKTEKEKELEVRTKIANVDIAASTLNGIVAPKKDRDRFMGEVYDIAKAAGGDILWIDDKGRSGIELVLNGGPGVIDYDTRERLYNLAKSRDIMLRVVDI